MRKYKCLDQQIFESEGYKLIPIRDEDKYEIMNWRNDQLDVLRQKEPISTEQQEWYFENVVAKLFKDEKPPQLLFSFLKNDVLIGYGGLVHIDWESENGEISFLTSKLRSNNQQLFNEDWSNYLELLKKLSQNVLLFHKIFTYAYSIRYNLFPILENNGFKKEATLKNHISINKDLYDVIIHSYFFPQLIDAEINDAKDVFDWRNDEMARMNSFNSDEINFEEHNNWYKNKLKDNNCRMLILKQDSEKLGMIRLDFSGENCQISYNIAPAQRGKGYGILILKLAQKYLKSLSVTNVIAQVKKHNTPSVKIFRKLNFIEQDKGDSYYYTKNILK